MYLQMPEHLTLSHDSTPPPSPTVRDVLMVIFRHRRLFVWSFLIVFFLVIAYATTTPRYEASMRLDREYIQRWSLALDVRILIKTIRVVFAGGGC